MAFLQMRCILPVAKQTKTEWNLPSAAWPTQHKMFSIQSPQPHLADSMPAKHTVRLPLRAFLLLVPQLVAHSHYLAPTCPPVCDSLYAKSLSSRGVTVQGTAVALGTIRETSESNSLFDRRYQVSKFNTKRKLEPSLFPRARVLAQTDASCNEEKTCPTLIPLTYKSPIPRGIRLSDLH